MRILAVDCLRCGPDILPDGIAWWSNDGHGYTTEWWEWRDYAADFAEHGYTFCAHGAEYAVTQLLYRHQEHVRVDYRDDRYISARWYWDTEHEPMPVWDCRPLCGNLSRHDLATAVGLQPYSTPQRYTWQYRRQWALPCYRHRMPECDECWGTIERAQWVCMDHGLPECDQCWKLQHARAIWEYMSQWSGLAEGYGLSPARTVGSMSHRLWRHLERPEPCALPDGAMSTFARQAYRAGRTECFKLGECGQVEYGDVSQMFAAVMRDIAVPKPESMRWLNQPSAADLTPDRVGVWDVTVDVPRMYVPPLGIMRYGHYTFPVGQFRGQWVTSELLNAMRYGVAVTHWHRALLGDQLIQPFSGYMAGLIDWREVLRKVKDPREIAVKLLANSLYGMIGLKEQSQSEYVMPMPEGTTFADWPHHDIRVLSDHILMRRADVTYRRSRFANPLWAACITADARVRLYDHLVTHGQSLVYCDTDSIITAGKLIPTGTEPGQLRYVDTYRQSHVVGPKMYRLTEGVKGDRIAHAGIPAWQVQRLVELGRASAYSPVGVLDSYWTGLDAGIWVTTPTDRRYETGKRRVIRPEGMWGDTKWTDTEPVVLSV